MRTEPSLGALPVWSVPGGGGTLRGVCAAAVVAVLLCVAGGCSGTPAPRLDARELVSPERLDRGYALLLPGIMGNTSTDHELTIGLAGADVPVAIEMYDWTEGPWQLLSNLRGLERNRREAVRVAEKIVAYQDAYPGRPVHVVGYSGGAGMAVMALEALPPGRRVTSTILLAATLAPDYDLRLAMGHSETGIRHFYSPIDVAILTGTMAVVGTMDGRHTVAAGAWGFKVPRGIEGEERRRYEQGLIQEGYALSMLASGNRGGHFDWVRPRFVEDWVAPLITSAPVPNMQTVAYRQRGDGRWGDRGEGDGHASRP